MAGDWLEKLLHENESKLQVSSAKRDQEMLMVQRLVALSRPVWQDIKKRLAARIDQFNGRMGSESGIEIIEGTAEFTFQCRRKSSPHSFRVSFTPSAGTITFGMASGNKTGYEDRWIYVQIDGDSTVTMKEKPTEITIEIDDVDEIILKDYIGSFLR